MRQLGSVLLKTSRANVLQSRRVVGVILVRTRLLAATRAVELHTNVLILAEASRDAIDGRGFGVGSFASAISVAVAAVILFETGEGLTLLCCVFLENLLMPIPDVLQPLFDRLPIVCPVELAHLPRVVNLLVSIEDDFMVIVERHVAQELEEGQLVCHLKIEPFHGDFHQSLGEATIYKLVKSQIVVLNL